MSKFSGYHDLYDSVRDIMEDGKYSNIHVYIECCPIELNIKCYKDIVPFLGCRVISCGRDNVNKIEHVRILDKLPESAMYRRNIHEEMLKVGYSETEASYYVYGKMNLDK